MKGTLKTFQKVTLVIASSEHFASTEVQYVL